MFPSLALNSGGRYGVVVTRRVVTGDGRPFTASRFFARVRDRAEPRNSLKERVWVLQLRNTSFRELRDDTILQVAKEALLDTDASITYIALKLGYSEASAFVRVFKRLAGASPLQFRKQARQPQ